MAETKRGFTLIETLIAITVLTLSIVGPLQIVQGVLNSAYNARDQLIGAGLAQEGMEFVRERRDTNYLTNVRYGSSYTWMYGVDGTLGEANCYTSNCAVDPQAGIFLPCGSSSCTPAFLYLDGTTYRYNNQFLGTPTKFIRTLRLTQISSTETLVTITVTWENHGARSVVLQENLRNWQ
jgi:prepilin-type N-terminal cleavage/methylation domain-containing protein